MGIRKMIDDYVECNEFEIKLVKDKVKVYYYDKINNFSQEKITIIKNDKKVDIEGKGLVIETMFEEFIIIGGKIKTLTLGKIDE